MVLAVGTVYLYSGGADLAIRAWSLKDFSQAVVTEVGCQDQGVW